MKIYGYRKLVTPSFFVKWEVVSREDKDGEWEHVPGGSRRRETAAFKLARRLGEDELFKHLQIVRVP